MKLKFTWTFTRINVRKRNRSGHILTCQSVTQIVNIRINSIIVDSRALIDYKTSSEDLKIIKLLLPQQNNDTLFIFPSGKPTTPTHFAIERNNLKLLEILLEHFTSKVQSVINDGWTLIHTASRFGRQVCLSHEISASILFCRSSK